MRKIHGWRLGIVIALVLLVVSAFTVPVSAPVQAVTWEGVQWLCGTCPLNGMGPGCAVCEVALAIYYWDLMPMT